MSVRFQQASARLLVPAYAFDFSTAGIALENKYIVNYELPGGATIVIENQKYTALPIEAKGFKESSRGASTRPSLNISNIQGFPSAIIQGAGALHKVSVTRRLCDINPQDGSSVVYKKDLWEIVSYRLMRSTANLTLSSLQDMAGYKSPRHTLAEFF